MLVGVETSSVEVRSVVTVELGTVTLVGVETRGDVVAVSGTETRGDVVGVETRGDVDVGPGIDVETRGVVVGLVVGDVVAVSGTETRGDVVGVDQRGDVDVGSVIDVGVTVAHRQWSQALPSSWPRE